MGELVDLKGEMFVTERTPTYMSGDAQHSHTKKANEEKEGGKDCSGDPI